MRGEFDPKTLGPKTKMGEIEEAQDIAAQVVKMFNTVGAGSIKPKVYGLRHAPRWEMTERRQRMEILKQHCLDLQVEVPAEVSEFLANYSEVDLSNSVNFYSECRPSQERGIEIKLKDVPETVETIRIVV